MSVIQIGLVDTTGKLNADLVQATAAALNVQVTRDLPQFWGVTATVIYLPHAKKLPAGVWPVQLVSHLPPGEGGFHLDKHNQPYAKVIATPGNDGWTVAASHETLEMLVDPYGNRLQSSREIAIVGGKIQDAAGEFSYLVEACDPCEADTYAYSVQGIAVSDFITPHFYDPMAAAGTRYSFTGAIPGPRQILPGGYISWIDQTTEEWQQLQYLSATPEIVTLGPATGTMSLRAWIDSQMPAAKRPPFQNGGPLGNAALAEHVHSHRKRLDEIAMKRAKLYA